MNGIDVRFELFRQKAKIGIKNDKFYQLLLVYQLKTFTFMDYEVHSTLEFKPAQMKFKWMYKQGYIFEIDYIYSCTDKTKQLFDSLFSDYNKWLKEYDKKAKKILNRPINGKIIVPLKSVEHYKSMRIKKAMDNKSKFKPKRERIVKPNLF